MKSTSNEYFRNFFTKKDSRKRLLSILLLTALIIYLVMYAQPKVYLTAQIKPVTEKDYNLFLQYSQNGYGGNAPLESRTRENCRLLTVDLQVKKPFLLVRNINISKNNLNRYLGDKQYFDKTADEFHDLGSYYSTDNNYHSIDGIDIYLAGMTDEKVYNFFGDYKIEISWVDLLNRKHKEYYYLKDYYK